MVYQIISNVKTIPTLIKTSYHQIITLTLTLTLIITLTLTLIVIVRLTLIVTPTLTLTPTLIVRLIVKWIIEKVEWRMWIKCE